MTRDVSYRIDVLRNGAPITQLQWDTGSPPQIMSDRAASIHGTLKGSFLPNAIAAWESDELRPWIIVNGTEHSLGIYQAATVSQKGSAGSTRIEIEAYDRCWRVYTQKAPRRSCILPLARRTSLEIRKLLTDCGISLVIATPNAAVLATDREDWPIGTSYLTIINTLLRRSTMKASGLTRTACAASEPYQEPSAAIHRLALRRDGPVSPGETSRA
ncbi:MAG: hypothetical protein ACLU3I_05630 [Acutalibacteraceae bacterium]